MDFDWDEAKSDANYRERGFDFEFASLIFEGFTLERADNRKEYGEVRVIAVGRVADLCLTLVYTDRSGPEGVTRRIISARRSNQREREAYEEARRG